MLKGVHRQVLEIQETDSKYFERAFFFVRPEFADEKEAKLRKAAEDALRQETKFRRIRTKRTKKHVLYIVAAVCLVLVSAGCTAFLCFIL